MWARLLNIDHAADGCLDLYSLKTQVVGRAKTFYRLTLACVGIGYPLVSGLCDLTPELEWE